jgi:hypothetical protein
MGYNVFNDDYGYINTFTFRDEKGRELSDDIQITYIELEKTNELLGKPVEELTNAECWGLFLRYASYDDKRQVLDKITEKNGGIRMAVDVLRYISKSDIERMRYEDEILAEIDQEAEVDYARKDERNKRAKRLLKHLDVETIAQEFDMTIEEVEELKGN